MPQERVETRDIETGTKKGYGSLQHKRRYHKYTTRILIRSFLDPPQSQVSKSPVALCL